MGLNCRVMGIMISSSEMSSSEMSSVSWEDIVFLF